MISRTFYRRYNFPITDIPIIVYDGECMMCNKFISTIDKVSSFEKIEGFTSIEAFVSTLNHPSKGEIIEKLSSLESIIVLYGEKMYSKSSAISFLLIKSNYIIAKLVGSIVFCLNRISVSDCIYSLIASKRLMLNKFCISTCTISYTKIRIRDNIHDGI